MKAVHVSLCVVKHCRELLGHVFRVRKSASQKRRFLFRSKGFFCTWRISHCLKISNPTHHLLLCSGIECYSEVRPHSARINTETIDTPYSQTEDNWRPAKPLLQELGDLCFFYRYFNGLIDYASKDATILTRLLKISYKKASSLRNNCQRPFLQSPGPSLSPVDQWSIQFHPQRSTTDLIISASGLLASILCEL